MKVLALVTEAYGGHGGIAQAARDILNVIAAQRVATRIDVLPRFASDRPSGIPAKVRQEKAEPGKLQYAIRAITWALLKRPNVIFCNHLFMAPLAAMAARLANAKLVIQLHGIEIWQGPSVVQRLALEIADLLLCVSRDTRRRALAYADLPPERAVVLNNTFAPMFKSGDRARARAIFGFRGEFVLLTVGRLDARERYKGHDRVISAMRALQISAGRPLLYVIAGDGDDRERLESAAYEAGVWGQMRFLGLVPGCDLPDLYRAADLFVLPSTGEGFGIAFLEAMASGTPAIGLAEGGAPDALGDGSLGGCVALEDFDLALATAVHSGGCQSHLLPQVVQERFGPESFSRALARHLRLLLDDSGGVASMAN